ncbi:Alpha/beta hydrolase [Vibrio chagasii]|uniref:alpha/beta hydrolase n=1 Tax=Vibrio chagasii TaxID=170679 RepID=UPI001EFEE37E|nr:alpha/beta hydrolase [Vibrio chagasii]MDE9381076.1 alpha/beta hydrolase [Vibrio alginolyticus]MCG9605467.1 alpha/beta hydrolase [Vibrio chagasii]CAH6820150.1 Alpha/beta hydrolase [Vibrio chagasii]CAH6828642.1 Alpha/beta hydrolase [Vibrio chagasii]CAH6832620.1 Alpha/beta hydrolase [Vibrio chagasii]
MKYYRNALLALPLILLAGCQSGSNTMKKQLPQPKADYVFSSAKLGELYQDREELQEAFRLSYDGVQYEKVMFAEDISEQQKVIRLVDRLGQTIDVYLPDAGVDTCGVYKEGNFYDAFECNAAQRSVSNETTLIQTTTSDRKQPIEFEFYTEALDYVTTLGSTVLNRSLQDNKVTITTSFAFKAFYRDRLNKPAVGERIDSTLGASTYSQLFDIVKLSQGRDMTLKFDNHIGGSGDDEINMYTGRMIHSNKMTTIVTPRGSVFSGGTDLFAAGYPRILQRADTSKAIEQNKQVGVHSWAEGDKTAKEFPYTNESHRSQATYFKKVMGDKGIAFYMFTLNSAPASGEHWMTKADSDKYSFITRIE